MAYATKYLFKWESVNGTTREIRVLLDGYSGSVIQRRLGRAPVLKKQHNGNVYGTSLEFYAECTVDGEFAEFYTTDPKAYRVDLYSGNTLLWQGYITPELYAEPDIAPPYDVQVIATDGVGELKLYDFAPQGLVSLRSMLTYLLGYTGLTTDVYLISSIKPGGSGAAGSLLEKTINLDYMAGESCYEVLSYILDTLHATITWWKGAWILARETNVKFSSGKVQYFNTSGNAGTLAGSVVTLGKMYANDAWPVGQLSSKIDPAKNSVRIQAPWHPVTALSNPDMTSDTGWTKAGGVVYDSTNKGYHLPEASLSAIPRISQTLALSSLKNPMTLAAKVIGVSADLSLSTLFTAAMGFYVTYEVSGTTYHLERSDEGLVWKQGAMPSLLNYTNTIFTFLKTFDEDRTGAQTVDIEIPPFLLNNAFPAGTLAVYVFGGCVRVYGASLDVIISKGYQDNLYLDNDARGEGDEVEIAIGRETSAISPYQAFLQGLLLDSGSLITSFKDDYITSSGLDFMSFIARDYARSFALPRIVQTGTVSLESSVTFPPLVFTKGALDYWLEGYSWNMLDDELDISARSLPTATITVDSETVTEAGGTASSAAQGGSSSGGGSMPSGINYFEQDDDQQELIKLKAAFSYLGPKKGLIFGTTEEADVASSPAHLMLRNLGTAQSPNYALYTPYALITGGDQIVGSGTPGGGGGGAGYLYELGDIYHDTDKTKVLRDPDYATTTGQQAQPGDVLVLDSTHGWAAVPSASIGGVTSVVGQTGDVTAAQISTAIGLGDYLPLSAGSSYPLTGFLVVNSGDTVPIIMKGASAQVVAVYNDGTTNRALTGWHSSYGAYMYNYTSNKVLNITDAGALLYNTYTVYHSGNFVAGTDYLPMIGGVISNADRFPLVINDSRSTDTWVGLGYRINSVHLGCLGFSSAGDPVYANASGTLKKLWHEGNFTPGDYLPLSLSSNYYITRSDDNWVLYFKNTSSSGGSHIGFYKNANYLGTVGFDDSGNLVTYGGSPASYRTVYHSGNANNTSTPWTCQYLQATSNGSRIAAYATTPLNSSSDLGGTALEVGVVSGFGLYMWTDGTGNGFIQEGRNTGSTRYNLCLQPFGGNVGIGTNSPAYKLDVNGSIASGGSLGLSGTSGDGTYGLSLYGGASYHKFYGIWVGLSSVGGTHGSVTGNFNMYFTCSNGSTRGFIFRVDDSSNVASISNGGVLTTNGDQVISSDIIWKTNLQPVKYTIEDIAKCRAVTFDWKDGRGKSAGSIAQDWKPLIPELVHGEEGNMTLAYGQIALVNTILLAKHETEQDKEIKALKNRVKELENEVKRLRS